MIADLALLIRDMLVGSISKCFTGDFPSLSDEGVVVKLDASSEVIHYFGQTVSETPMPRVKIVARSKKLDTVIDWLDAVNTILDHYNDDSVSITIEGMPVYNGRDDQKLHEMEVLYKIIEKE